MSTTNNSTAASAAATGSTAATAANSSSGNGAANWTSGSHHLPANWTSQGSGNHGHYSQPIGTFGDQTASQGSQQQGSQSSQQRSYASLARNGSGRELRTGDSAEEAEKPKPVVADSQIDELDMEDDDDDDLTDDEYQPDEDGTGKKRGSKRKTSQSNILYDQEDSFSAGGTPTTSKRQRSSLTPGAKDGPLLGPADPIQPRKYVKPSSTSRKAVPKAFARTTKGKRATAELDVALEHNEEGEVELPPSIKDAIDIRRQQNTLAARESRRRKKEHLENLERENAEQRQMIASLEHDLRETNERNAQLERELLEFRIGGAAAHHQTSIGAMNIPVSAAPSGDVQIGLDTEDK